MNYFVFLIEINLHILKNQNRNNVQLTEMSL